MRSLSLLHRRCVGELEVGVPPADVEQHRTPAWSGGDDDPSSFPVPKRPRSFYLVGISDCRPKWLDPVSSFGRSSPASHPIGPSSELFPARLSSVILMTPEKLHRNPCICGPRRLRPPARQSAELKRKKSWVWCRRARRMLFTSGSPRCWLFASLCACHATDAIATSRPHERSIMLIFGATVPTYTPNSPSLTRTLSLSKG